MRISDGSSDVCSSDLRKGGARRSDGAMEVILARIGGTADDLLGRRVEHVETRAAAVEPASDQHRIVAVEFHRHSPLVCVSGDQHDLDAVAARLCRDRFVDLVEGEGLEEPIDGKTTGGGMRDQYGAEAWRMAVVLDDPEDPVPGGHQR